MQTAAVTEIESDQPSAEAGQRHYFCKTLVQKMDDPVGSRGKGAKRRGMQGRGKKKQTTPDGKMRHKSDGENCGR